MPHTPRLPGGNGHEAELDTTSALLAMAAPSTVPGDDVFAEETVEEAPSLTPERGFPKASWLDALPSEAFETRRTEPARISSVNSDDNGLYRMFVGVSP